MERKRILIKHICLILGLLVLLNTYFANAQKVAEKKFEPSYKEIDTTLLINKAKLLTLSRSGVDDLDSIINCVLAQKSRLIHASNKFYDIIMVESNLRYITNVKTKSGISTRFCGENFKDTVPCLYTLVFSYHTDRFYLLSGFSECEIKELNEEMSKFYVDIYDVFTDELNKKISINFDCLVSKYLYPEDDKSRNVKCYKECGKCREPAEVN